MVNNVINFQHENDTIPTALGFTKEVDERCREIVNFVTFTNAFIKEDFYEDLETMPSNLTTITGTLEKSLQLCKSDQEQVYLLFIFRTVYDHSKNAILAYMEFNNQQDEKEKKKMKMLLELVELKALADEEDRNDIITPKDMFKKIQIAKQNMFNFDNYFNIVNES